jgi:hypothetical protein
MKISAVISFMVSVAMIGCAPKYFLMDTASDTVFEYENDYYVSKIDTSVELHYQFWSQDGALWLSTLNTSKQVMFLILDSTYLKFDGEKQYFDFLVDWSEYSSQLATIPNLTDYDFNKVLPIIPGQWKGMLSDPFPMGVKEWSEQDPLEMFTKETSPWQIEVQVCFFQGGNAYTPICKNDEVWVESFIEIDANQLRSLELDPGYKKADKFYITNSLGWGG